MIKTFGLFHGNDQVGFQCFAEYVPWKDKTQKRQMHSNRTVIHPDYVGLGMGMKLINETSAIMQRNGFDVRAKFSSLPVFKAMSKAPEWRLDSVQLDTPHGGSKLGRGSGGMRVKTKTYSFRYVGKPIN